MNAWTKAAVQGAACGLMIGVVLLIGGRAWKPETVAAQTKQPIVPDVVRARSFEVVDTTGKVRAVLGATPGAPGRIQLPAVGKEPAKLLVVPEGNPGLVLFDASGKQRAELTLYAAGDPGLVLFDAAERERAELTLFSNGDPSLTLSDGAGKKRAELTAYPNGDPSLELRDATEKVRAVLGAADLEGVNAGKERARSESSLVLFGKDGKVLWAVP